MQKQTLKKTRVHAHTHTHSQNMYLCDNAIVLMS